MKNILITAAAISLGTAGLSAPAFADGHEGADAPEMSNVDWYRVNLIKWKPGKGGRAHEIIDKFEAVDKALGLDGVKDFHMGTGPWDSIVALPLRHGIAQLGWKKNPDDEKWEAEFARQNGGPEAAKALYEEFESLIARQDRHIGHIDRD